MAIRFPRREGSRKPVQAMRAKESGQPDWDAPSHAIHGNSSPSNKELMARKAAKAEARDKSLNPADHWSTKPATVEKSRSDDSRMRNYGDD